MFSSYHKLKSLMVINKARERDTTRNKCSVGSDLKMRSIPLFLRKIDLTLLNSLHLRLLSLKILNKQKQLSHMVICRLSLNNEVLTEEADLEELVIEVDPGTQGVAEISATEAAITTERKKKMMWTLNG